jgi:uncharacterized membrane protein (UPF0127 family)
MAIGVMVMALPTGCTTGTEAASAPSTAPASAPATATEPATKPIAFETTTMTLKGKAFTLEVAQTSEQTQRGLMYRDSMADDHGMLFVMPYLDTWQFWMHNTRIPLDIIFIDRSGQIVEIHQRQAMDETSMGPARPVQYVIELNRGTAQKIGLRRGDTIEMPKKLLPN